MTPLPGLVVAERVAGLVAELVAIPSVNPFGSTLDRAAEGAVAHRVADLLGDLGADVDIEEVAADRFNVFGSFLAGEGRRRLMLAGHTDTVGVDGYQNPFEPRIEDGRLFGRGSCDMKGGLGAILEAVTVMVTSGFTPMGEVVVAALCDEEFEMLGSRHAAGRADLAVVAEPTSLAVCPAHKGQLGVVVRTRGAAAHSSRPELGTNAIDAMGRVLDRLRSYGGVLAQAEPHAMCGLPSFNVGVIRGGTIASVVPAECWIEIDRRTLPGESFADVADEIDAHLASLRDTGVEFEIEGPTWDIPSLDVPLEAPIVAMVGEAHRSVTGTSAQVRAFPAATDAPNLGCQAVVYGPGDLGRAHSTDEWIDLEELETAARVFAALIESHGAS